MGDKSRVSAACKRAYPTAGNMCRVSARASQLHDKKFAPESQNRRQEMNIDPAIEYTYTLRGTSE